MNCEMDFRFYSPNFILLNIKGKGADIRRLFLRLIDAECSMIEFRRRLASDASVGNAYLRKCALRDLTEVKSASLKQGNCLRGNGSPASCDELDHDFLHAGVISMRPHKRTDFTGDYHCRHHGFGGGRMFPFFCLCSLRWSLCWFWHWATLRFCFYLH